MQMRATQPNQLEDLATKWEHAERGVQSPIGQMRATQPNQLEDLATKWEHAERGVQSPIGQMRATQPNELEALRQSGSTQSVEYKAQQDK